jgi:nicotinamidase-related amidase
MNPKTTAIVLIEYQNDFTTPGGVFHDGVKDVTCWPTPSKSRPRAVPQAPR